MSLSVPSLLLLVCLVLQVSADGQAQYGVPDTGYDSSYSQPSAPTRYSAPRATDADRVEPGGDSAPQEDGLDLGKLTDLIPIFVVVFAAIILAQLIAPLFAQLFALLLAIIPGTLSFKAPLINALIAPFNLQLCTTDNPPVAFPTSRGFSSRDLGKILGDFDPKHLDTITTLVDEAVSVFSNMNV
jgi:hypothetical protein